MDEKRNEEPGTDTKVPRDLPESREEAAREEAIVEIPSGEEAPPDVYPDPDEAGSGRRGGAEGDVTGEEEILAEEPGTQEQPD